MSTSRSTRGRFLVAPALAAIVLAGAAVAVADEGGSDPMPQPREIAADVPGDPLAYAATTEAASPQQQAGTDVVKQVLGGLKSAPSPVVHASVARDPKGLSVRIDMADYDDTVEQAWYANLAFGALVEGARLDTDRSMAQVVTSAVVSGKNKAGDVVDQPLPVGAVALGQRFGSPSDAALTDRVRSVAAQYGLQTKNVALLHPLETALHVVLEVPDGASIDWTVEQLRTALVGEHPDVEGLLIELVSPSGAPLLSAGTAYRTGLGGLWFAPDQDTRFGALHGGLAFK